jgi:hypothetical protein
MSTEWVLHTLANFSGCHVIFDPKSLQRPARGRTTDHVSITWEESTDMASLAIKSLKKNGWRVLEQRFPRRAYVVIWDEGATP